MSGTSQRRALVRPTLYGHTGHVDAVALGVLDDRPFVVSGGKDHTIRLWDLGGATPSCVRVHPRATGIGACTVEILRELGLDTAVDAAAGQAI